MRFAYLNLYGSLASLCLAGEREDVSGLFMPDVGSDRYEVFRDEGS